MFAGNQDMWLRALEVIEVDGSKNERALAEVLTEVLKEVGILQKELRKEGEVMDLVLSYLKGEQLDLVLEGIEKHEAGSG